ncbi:MAG: hypothetical protein ACREWG_07540 [Gammaproteobacteria bacterium]
MFWRLGSTAKGVLMPALIGATAFGFWATPRHRPRPAEVDRPPYPRAIAA